MAKRRVKGRWLMTLGVLFMLAALLLAGYYLLEEQRSNQAAQDVLQALNQHIPHETPVPQSAETTPNLIMTDSAGQEVEWPLMQSGQPMPWPVDEMGMPAAQMTDEQGALFIWQSESNRPVRVSEAPAAPQETADLPAREEISAMPEGPSPEIKPQDTAVLIVSTTPMETGTPQLPEATIAPSAVQTPEMPSLATPDLPQVQTQSPQTNTPPTVTWTDERMPSTDVTFSEEMLPSPTWSTNTDGMLMPYISDGQGQVVPWLTDESGAAMTLEALSGIWQTVLEQLTLNWQKILNLPDFIRDPDMPMPVTTLDGHDYIGIIDIPSQRLSLPIMSDWSYTQLRITPCRYKGSVYAGDIILAGHNNSRHFSPIKKLVVGDEVRFTDADGNVFIYSVISMETINGHDVPAMLEGSETWDLTMFTCSHSSMKRYTVRCKLERYIVAEKKP